ncbi:tetratricopeptide (TPR) repeat protein [Duganella sp. 1224]|uniref:tetratricopeptide repeat protein n=1 Tax=Duganella sp. 1224 TaxID=2587052 RepID=UPI00184D2F9C|nr:tetratricopeptide repeat protein [Duganella sp. 1224]NYE60468.1 tetratricopeptide (TPR) repeat protein [Duganella sp. 1224]
MSLLMQALKKAERAKQNALPDEELDKPSQAFDEILALTPEPAPRAAAAPSTPAASPVEFSLEPMDGLSLEPMAPPVSASVASEPRPSPSPLPAVSDHKEPGLTMDLALDPIAAPPTVAAPMPALAPGPELTASTTPAPATASAGSAAAARGAGSTPTASSAAESAVTYAEPAGTSAARTAAASAAAIGGALAGTVAAAGAASPAASRPAPAASAASAASPGPTAASAPRGAAPAGAPGAAGNGGNGGNGGSGGKRSDGATRARARTAAAAEPSSFDPERLRLFGLIALLVIVVGGLGGYYWIALTGPGAGAGLPPVPMPPAGATGATTGAGQIIAANSGPGSASDIPGAGPGGPGTDADDPLLAPTGISRASQQDLERRLARTEQELAAAQQAIQAAAAPRAEQMPVLAAPKNDDIRITRLVQPAPVSPTLDSAYQAFNSGDTAGAQQQYEAALAQDANNRDALLGAAHVAARQNLKDKAAGYYLRLLELSPNDADATAGLIGLRQGDISQSEARLKAILANTPDAGPVLFALGNLYAQQGRWPDAQQAYFRAVGAAPDNPDYAYNLAIGLDRLNQGKLALGYYQRALALAQDKAVGFDRNALRKRMHELSTVTH